MPSEDMAVRLIVEQRKRLVASILGYAERSFWSRLSQDEREDFRAKVFDAVGVYTDFTRDLLRVADEGVLRNERALEMIEAIHSSQRLLVEQLGGTRG